VYQQPQYVYSMDEETLSLLADLHVHNSRQGPGSDGASLQALALADVDVHAPLQIADVGCGTGAASILLAQHTAAHISAVDFLPRFLAELEVRAQKAGVTDRITPYRADMQDLPFGTGSLDVMWSEGAIYNIGFNTGVRAWRNYLKPGGVLVLTEITWLRPSVPEELSRHWDTEYPEVATASTKIKQLEEAGYVSLGYFPLSADCWLTEYYMPLEQEFAAFLARNKNSEAAQAIVEAEMREIALYKQYAAYYSYGCYVARKND